jgi:hypothetical protein
LNQTRSWVIIAQALSEEAGTLTRWGQPKR